MPRMSFLTLTFRRDVTSREGLMLLANRLKRYKNKFSRFVFYPEYGKNHKFHFHGFIQCENINQLYLSSFLGNWKRYLGFYKDSLSPYGNSDVIQWHQYCIKDQYLWKQKRLTKLNYKRYLYIKLDKSHKTIMDYFKSTS